MGAFERYTAVLAVADNARLDLRFILRHLKPDKVFAIADGNAPVLPQSRLDGHPKAIPQQLAAVALDKRGCSSSPTVTPVRDSYALL